MNSPYNTSESVKKSESKWTRQEKITAAIIGAAAVSILAIAYPDTNPYPMSSGATSSMSAPCRGLEVTDTSGHVRIIDHFAPEIKSAYLKISAKNIRNLGTFSLAPGTNYIDLETFPDVVSSSQQLVVRTSVYTLPGQANNKPLLECPIKST